MANPQGRLKFREGDTPTITWVIENVDISGFTTLEMLIDAPQGLLTLSGVQIVATPQGSTATFTAAGDDLQVKDAQRAVVVWIIGGVVASAEAFFMDVAPKPS